MERPRHRQAEEGGGLKSKADAERGTAPDAVREGAEDETAHHRRHAERAHQSRGEHGRDSEPAREWHEILEARGGDETDSSPRAGRQRVRDCGGAQPEAAHAGQERLERGAGARGDERARVEHAAAEVPDEAPEPPAPVEEKEKELEPVGA